MYVREICSSPWPLQRRRLAFTAYVLQREASLATRGARVTFCVLFFSSYFSSVLFCAIAQVTSAFFLDATTARERERDPRNLMAILSADVVN